MAKSGIAKQRPESAIGRKRIPRLETPIASPDAHAQRGTLDFLAHHSEMGRLIGSIDWATTPIGAIETWSPALRMMVSFMLANRFPLLLWWGPQYVSIYNDAYRPILGTKHPNAMGQPVSECWSEIWHVLQPLIDSPFRGGPATWMEDIFLEINRHGFIEETHFTIAYSPVPDDTALRGIGGVLATVHEITEKVVGERRVVILRDLGARASEAKTAEEACAIGAETLAKHPHDIPFALIYLVDPDSQTATLAGAAGTGMGRPISPLVVDLKNDATAAIGWPLGSTMHAETMRVIEQIGSRFPSVPAGPWSDPPHTAVVVPIPSNKAHQIAGILVAGISSRLKLDDRYRDFLGLTVTQIGTAITNARAYEDERKRAEALAEIDRAKTRFFSNVSHEFRTPLTLMLGPIEDVLRDESSASMAQVQRERLRVAHRNSLRLLKLVNTLLDFSRIEAGRTQANYAPCDLASLTTELSSNFRSACEKAGVDLVVDCSPLPEPVYVDRDMWEKVVLNLLSNAFKFTFEGRIEVQLKACTDVAELVVRDTGVGVPPRELPRIFERFHRIEGQKGRSYEGSGIGLALVQELVRLHGGTIRVESEVGKGTAFTVILPFGTKHLPAERIHGKRTLASTSLRADAFVEEALRWLPNAATPPEALPTDRETQASAPSLIPVEDRPHILFADDNSDMRDYVRRLLDGHYRVETVADGQAALEAIRRHQPDIVLADVMMPGLDGFSLLREIRADPDLKSVPVILVSARAGEEARLEGLEAGVDDYLTKPFSARELIARIGGQLQLARARRQADRAVLEEMRTLEILNRVGSIVAAEIDLKRAVQAVTDAATELTGAAFGSFFYNVLDEHGERYTLYTLSGASREAFSKFPLPRNTAVFATTFSGEGIVRSDDILEDPRYGKNEPHFGMPEGHLPVRSYLAAPVISRSGEVLGGLFFGHPEPGIFKERSERLLIGIAAQAAIAIDNGRLYQAAQAEIAERKRAEQALLEGEERLRRANTELSQRLADLQQANMEIKKSRRAALNLMEDAVQSSRDMETLNAALRESEERYRTLFHSAPMAVFVCDLKAVIQSYNERAVDLWGREPVCGVEQHFGSAKLWLPDGTLLPGAQSPMMEVLRTGTPVLNVEVFIERPDGSRLPVIVNFAPLRNAQSEIIGAIISFTDITKRKQAEEALREGERRFREMIDALPAAVYTTDAEGRLTHFNPAAAEFAGRVPELGTDEWSVSWKLYHPDGTPMPLDECPMAIALKEDRIVRGAEAILERPDGSRRWFAPYPTPMRDAGGRIVGGINMLFDITGRKQAEERQQLLMNELNHRVKNTLATVQSIAAQSLKGVSDPEHRKAFDARLVSLSRTHDLLSRATWESASLRELLLLELNPYGSEEGGRFVIDGPEVTVNPKAALALGLAFHELATNAAKYGALSALSGQVLVAWDVSRSSASTALRLKWTETGGPPVKKTGRKGFGTTVIERGLSLDLDGEVQVDFNPSGLIFTVEIPLVPAGENV